MSCNDTAINDLANDMTVIRRDGTNDYTRQDVNDSSWDDYLVARVCDDADPTEYVNDLSTSDTVMTEDASGDCDEFLDMPSVCDDFSTNGYYLVDMDGGSFNASGCTQCEDSSQTVWDGAFDEAMGVFCDNSPNNYYANYFGALYGWDDYSVGGKKIYYAQDFFAASYSYYYYVWIGCAYDSGGGSYGDQSVWEGYKYCGVTPAGEYERTGGCDSTSTVTVAAL
jgi:hypothetical protein